MHKILACSIESKKCILRHCYHWYSKVEASWYWTIMNEFYINAMLSMYQKFFNYLSNKNSPAGLAGLLLFN